MCHHLFYSASYKEIILIINSWADFFLGFVLEEPEWQ